MLLDLGDITADEKGPGIRPQGQQLTGCLLGTGFLSNEWWEQPTVFTNPN